MRKLVFILIAFIAAVTFIRAFDKSGSADSILPTAMTGVIPGREINFDLDH
jgi:hypothetical protein